MEGPEAVSSRAMPRPNDVPTGRAEDTGDRALTVQVITWAPAVSWMALIFVLPAQPGLRVADDAMADYILRKAAHVVVFAVLAVLLVPALSARRRPVDVSAAFRAFAVAVLYAVSDELHQAAVADRDPSVFDVGFDAFGAALGAGFAARWAAHTGPQ